ncbi:hypothetical protein AALB39_27635 [Lachnospiraceae bacterium 54-53]
MKVLVIYNHENGAILAIQYGVENTYNDLRNEIFEIGEGEQITGLTIDGDNVQAIIEETQTSALAKEIESLKSEIDYLKMMSA